jgi:hypothetical protein
MNDIIEIHYRSDRPQIGNVGRTHNGFLCLSLSMSHGQVVETWKAGEYDPEIYLPCESSPFVAWRQNIAVGRNVVETPLSRTATL